MKKILIVEDDASINNMLRELLAGSGYETVQSFSGTEALLRLGSESFDLILLDLMLPGKTGAEVLEELRAGGASSAGNTPVIALTAISDKDSVVNLLRAGADDYITKPFDTGELLARIEARLRSSADETKARGKTLRFGKLALNSECFDAYPEGDESNLAGLGKREFDILRLLMENPNKVFTKDNIYESVWKGEYMGDDNTVNVHISKIRAKLEAILPGEEYIQTVWGIGYKMKS